MLEIIGMFAIWLLGALASFYIPIALISAFKQGGLEVMALRELRLMAV